MANTFSALKRVRQTERRTVFNRVAKTRLRHQIRTMRRALAAKGAGKDAAKSHGDLNAIMAATFSLVDKAARKGYIKRGTAARYKGRLHKKVKAVLGETQK
jgi:small subunit ribosomal protein S20